MIDRNRSRGRVRPAVAALRHAGLRRLRRTAEERRSGLRRRRLYISVDQRTLSHGHARCQVRLEQSGQKVRTPGQPFQRRLREMSRYIQLLLRSVQRLSHVSALKNLKT